MTTETTDGLSQSPEQPSDPSAFLRAAIRWHFSPDTGSAYWLRRAETLGFDPIGEVMGFDDLRRFPNVADELRDVPTEDLIPRGFGPRPQVLGVIESGGTTGAPKRLPLLREFAERMTENEKRSLRAFGVSRTRHWLSMFPAGPHGAFEQIKRAASGYGDGILVFGVDIDPRWVKKLTAAGRRDAVNEYVEHIVDQAAYVLRSQDVGSLRVTPPILARIVERDELVDLLREKVEFIGWGGAHMDAESRSFYRSELFPHARLRGSYGTTMALGAGCIERPGLAPDDPCIMDPGLAPFVTLAVVDPATSEPVDYGERGRIVVHHVSQSFFLPNNAERDEATRVHPLSPSDVGDSVADITPSSNFGGTTVVEGVY